MIEVITTKDDSSMSEKMYSKDVGNSALILEWIPISVEITFIGALTGTVLGLILRMATRTNFSIKEYLVSDSAIVGLCLYSLAAFFWSLYWGWRRYHLIKKEFFASVNDENLMLRFGRNSFLWENIQKVDLEGDRRLIITSDKRKIKRNLFDLKWLSGKEDFIHSLKDYSRSRNIPYHESEISFFSRMSLFLNSLIQYPFA